MTIDPSIDKQTLSTYLSQAFQLPISELPEEGNEEEESTKVWLRVALERLQMADVKRIGPRETEPAS